MEKCSCYHAVDNWLGLPGVCWGTKEREPCRCGGDESKCDFYPEKKKGAVEMGNKIDDAYKKGAEDAWEAARKIVLDKDSGGLSISELGKVFGTVGYYDIMQDKSPLDAIEKIRQYEKRNEFQVGDEVQRYGASAVVVRTHLNDDESKMYVVFQDGSCGRKDKEDWTKTGRHFPQIAEVLGMMGEAVKGE